MELQVYGGTKKFKDINEVNIFIGKKLLETKGKEQYNKFNKMKNKFTHNQLQVMINKLCPQTITDEMIIEFEDEIKAALKEVTLVTKHAAGFNYWNNHRSLTKVSRDLHNQYNKVSIDEFKEIVWDVCQTSWEKSYWKCKAEKLKIPANSELIFITKEITNDYIIKSSFSEYQKRLAKKGFPQIRRIDYHNRKNLSYYEDENEALQDYVEQIGSGREHKIMLKKYVILNIDKLNEKVNKKVNSLTNDTDDYYEEC